MGTIIPILLAGGSGTRLWPLSRQTFPKQFAKLVGENSLFQQALERCSEESIFDCSSLITITNEQYRFIVSDQIKNQGMDVGTVLLEPTSKNTAAAILAATLYVKKNHSDARILVLPSDHLIPNKWLFAKTIQKGNKFLTRENMITFGIKPHKVETGYGYILKGKEQDEKVFKIDGFTEKPDYEKSEKMVSSGKYVWNAGIFLFYADSLINSFRKYEKKLFDTVEMALEKSVVDQKFVRLEKKSWNSCRSISLDYAIMEKRRDLSVVVFDGAWSDLGDWNALLENSPQKDKKNTVISENAKSFDCQDVLLWSEDRGIKLVGMGLKDLIVVAMKDAVLVTSRSRSQDTKLIVEELIKEKTPQATEASEVHRPWGWYEVLSHSEQFQVKRITVKAGQKLSLQSHKYRSEHWVVVEGEALVTIDENISILNKGQSTYIPLGAIHRLENPGTSNLVLIEVQLGSYLGEDDIKRYEDIYSRESQD